MSDNKKLHRQIITLEQAEEILPEITLLVYEIQESYKKTKKLRKSYEKFSTGAFSEKRVKGETAIIERQLLLEYSKMEEIAEEIEEIGGILQSACEGQVDFIVNQNAKKVHLCWHLGEDELLYWHFPNQPCAKRKFISPQILNRKFN